MRYRSPVVPRGSAERRRGAPGAHAHTRRSRALSPEPAGPGPALRPFRRSGAGPRRLLLPAAEAQPGGISSSRRPLCAALSSPSPPRGRFPPVGAGAAARQPPWPCATETPRSVPAPPLPPGPAGRFVPPLPGPARPGRLGRRAHGAAGPGLFPPPPPGAAGGSAARSGPGTGNGAGRLRGPVPACPGAHGPCPPAALPALSSGSAEKINSFNSLRFDVSFFKRWLVVWPSPPGPGLVGVTGVRLNGGPSSCPGAGLGFTSK